MDSRKARREAEKAFEKRLMDYINANKTATTAPFFLTNFNWATAAAYAVMLFILIILLSSAAWGHGHGHYNICATCTSDDFRRIPRLRLLAGVSGALDFRLVREEVWASPKKPVEFIIAWPHLPSVEEVQIKLAKEAMAMSFRKAEEARKALELKLDFDALIKALALALMSVGTIITVVLGFGNIPNSRNRI